MTSEELELREIIGMQLEEQALLAIRSNEYNFNDTAVRAKTFLLASDIVRNTID